jgi:hypothetical protein
MDEIGPNTVLEIWYSGPENDSAKRVLFDEAVRQGRIVVHWKSYHDEHLAEIIVMNEEDNDGTE